MKKPTLTLKPERPAYGGIAIARWQGKVVMIKGAIPDETVEVCIDEEKKDYSTGHAVKVLEPSPDRVRPECGHFGICGGCQLQYISYSRQVSLKEEVLKDCLARIAGMVIMLDQPLTGEPWNYRHRGQFKVSHGKVGLFREKSHEVTDIGSCPLMTARVNEYYGKARTLIMGTDVRELHITCDDGALALIKARSGHGANWDGLGKGLIQSGFSGAAVELHGGRLMGYGQGHIAFDLLGLKYTVSPASFFQSNWGLNQSLVKLVMDRLQPLAGRSVLDLYSGAGNFSLPLAVHAGRVTAVEENPAAVSDGERNAVQNEIKNCTFIRSNAASIEVAGPVDILVTDPPRTGLAEGVADKVLGLAPDRIAYISCNPSTLARDLKKLAVGYIVESVRMVDFFPQTYHIESLAFLRKKA